MVTPLNKCETPANKVIRSVGINRVRQIKLKEEVMTALPINVKLVENCGIRLLAKTGVR